MRSRAYYRHQRRRAIARKMERVKFGRWWVPPGKEGILSKGKTHCSCRMCTNKTKFLGWHKNDQSKLDAMKREIDDFMKGTE